MIPEISVQLNRMDQIVTYQQKLEQLMHVNNKEEILKLLNFDTMINQYLKQPRLNRKTPATNNKQKTTKPFIPNSNMMSTFDVSLSNKRNLSAHQFTKTTLQPPTSNKNNPNHRSIFKVQSSRVNKLNQLQTEELNKFQQRKITSSSKLLRTQKTIQAQSMSQLAQSVLKKVAKKRKIDIQSTNPHDSDNQQEQTIPQRLAGVRESKRKIASKVAHNSQAKWCKMGSILKGRYQLEKIIGRGLSGQVYKAKDILSQRYVAIKIIQPSNIQYEFIKQLQHPNMISYYNSFIENEKRCIVLEYLPHSLAEIIRKRKLNEDQVKRAFKSIASGLMYLHSLSYAHRDIKPDNLVTNEDFSTVKFIDFGLCIDTNQSDPKELRRCCGTASYMAPQIISYQCREPKRADIWSLGVVLYLLFVGRNPFTGRQQVQVFNKIKNNKTIFPSDMPEKLKNLLSSMLQKNSEERPSIIEVINHSWLVD